MTTESYDGDDLVAGAVAAPAAQLEEEVVGKKDFLPWHKPRKHYIRIKQWCSHTQKLAQRCKQEFEFRSFRYLGLPGPDLLDVRLIQGALVKSGVKLSYLGFNSDGTQESSISQSEVNALEGIDPATSQVLPDRFESLSRSDSMASQRARAFAPFDVVNLDLCASAANTPPAATETIFAALKELFQIQHTKGANDWLLFLTTRADSASVNQTSLGILIECIRRNVASSETFGEKLQECLHIGVDELERPGALGPSSFALSVGLGIGKWLLATVGPSWEVELQAENFWYSVSGKPTDMLSLSFRFVRRPSVSDQTGLTGPTAPLPSPRSEVAMAEDMISSLAQISDPEIVLRDDPEQKRKMVEQSRKLLEQARYDGQAYERWVALTGC